MKTLRQRFLETLQDNMTSQWGSVYEKTVNKLLSDIEEHDKEQKAELGRRSREFDEDRYSEPPGTWKPVPGHVSPSGWVSY